MRGASLRAAPGIGAAAPLATRSTLSLTRPPHLLFRFQRRPRPIRTVLQSVGGLTESEAEAERRYLQQHDGDQQAAVALLQQAAGSRTVPAALVTGALAHLETSFASQNGEGDGPSPSGRGSYDQEPPRLKTPSRLA